MHVVLKGVIVGGINTNITKLRLCYILFKTRLYKPTHGSPFKGNSVKQPDILSSLKREKAVGIGSNSLRYVNTLTKMLKMYFKVNCLGAARADLFDLRYTFLCVSLWMKISYTDLEVVKYK